MPLQRWHTPRLMGLCHRMAQYGGYHEQSRQDAVAVSKVSLRLADEDACCECPKSLLKDLVQDCFVRARAVVALGRLGQKGDAQTLALGSPDCSQA